MLSSTDLPDGPVKGSEDALMRVYKDHAELLRYLTSHDFAILSGFITLNLAIAAWVQTYPPASILLRLAETAFIVGIATVACYMLWLQRCRRIEVVRTIRSINTYFGFNRSGHYMSGLLIVDEEPLNTVEARSRAKPRLWFPMYAIVVALIAIANAVIIWTTA